MNGTLRFKIWISKGTPNVVPVIFKLGYLKRYKHREWNLMMETYIYSEVCLHIVILYVFLYIFLYGIWIKDGGMQIRQVVRTHTRMWRICSNPDPHGFGQATVDYLLSHSVIFHLCAHALPNFLWRARLINAHQPGPLSRMGHFIGFLQTAHSVVFYGM
jgi:hypothetical protein